jgi:hypothetical protein
MMKRDDFRRLLDSVEPIPRMITVKSMGGIVMCVRPLKVAEERELAKHLSALSGVSKDYQTALRDGDAQAAEKALEAAKELNYRVRVEKIAYCLVDEDGQRLVEDVAELEKLGVDVIEELSDRIDEAATYKSLNEAIKKK